MSAEISLWVKDLRSPLVPGYSSHLFKCRFFFCKLETMTKEISALAITSLQQKPRENISFELVTAVLRQVLCPWPPIVPSSPSTLELLCPKHSESRCSLHLLLNTKISVVWAEQTYLLSDSISMLDILQQEVLTKKKEKKKKLWSMELLARARKAWPWADFLLPNMIFCFKAERVLKMSDFF